MKYEENSPLLGFRSVDHSTDDDDDKKDKKSWKWSHTYTRWQSLSSVCM